MSSANGILAVLRAWNGLCGPDEVLSVGVLCSGKDATQLKVWKKTNPNLDYLAFFFPAYFAGCSDLPDDAVLSVPVTFADGKWSVLADVSVGDELKERLWLAAGEIRRVRCFFLKQLLPLQCIPINIFKVLKVVFLFPRKKNLEQKLKQNESRS